MTVPYILPYRTGSKSAKALAEALGCKRLRLKGSKFLHLPDQLVVNWGNNSKEVLRDTIYPPCEGGGWSLNCGFRDAETLYIAEATNKLGFFNRLNENMPEYIPEYTTSTMAAKDWCQEGHTVVCRKLLRASRGDGIVIANVPENVVPAPLYVKYIKKQDEYRVHVFDGKVIDVQRKMRKKDVPDEEVNWKVRNLEGGFIFGREGIEPPEGMLDVCIKAVSCLGLDFGAVDVIYNAHSEKFYLLEVNTAPGLVGTTLELYTQAIREYCDKHK